MGNHPQQASQAKGHGNQVAVQTKTLNGQKMSHGVVSPKNNPGGKGTLN
jgi:hypothetical protein